MNELITNVLSGEASEIEHQQLRRWRRESPENERAFQEMEYVWRLSALQNPGASESQPPPVEDIIAEAELLRATVAPIQSTAKLQPTIWRWLPTAAKVMRYLLHRGPPTPGTS
jgi:ferric-dicitrate binding protein FerR (iron transport regulator)